MEEETPINNSLISFISPNKEVDITPVSSRKQGVGLETFHEAYYFGAENPFRKRKTVEGSTKKIVVETSNKKVEVEEEVGRWTNLVWIGSLW